MTPEKLAEFVERMIHNERNYILRTGEYHSNKELENIALLESYKFLKENEEICEF